MNQRLVADMARALCRSAATGQGNFHAEVKPDCVVITTNRHSPVRVRTYRLNRRIGLVVVHEGGETPLFWIGLGVSLEPYYFEAERIIQAEAAVKPDPCGERFLDEM